MIIKHKFVKEIPENLENGVIYVSMEYATAIHKCCCGCGNQVVTPLSPTDWKLSYDGKTITLDPSIGNWNFQCQSHYWIINSEVKWAPKWTQQQIRYGQKQDELSKMEYLNKTNKKGWRSLFQSIFGSK